MTDNPRRDHPAGLTTGVDFPFNKHVFAAEPRQRPTRSGSIAGTGKKIGRAFVAPGTGLRIRLSLSTNRVGRTSRVVRAGGG